MHKLHPALAAVCRESEAFAGPDAVQLCSGGSRPDKAPIDEPACRLIVENGTFPQKFLHDPAVTPCAISPPLSSKDDIKMAGGETAMQTLPGVQLTLYTDVRKRVAYHKVLSSTACIA